MSDQTIVRALRDTPVSDDGIKVRVLAQGTEGPVPSDAVAGLVAEGYVALPGTDVSPSDAEIIETRVFQAEETAASILSDLDVRITKSGAEDAARAALAKGFVPLIENGTSGTCPAVSRLSRSGSALSPILRVEPVGAGWFAIFRGTERVAKGFRKAEDAEAALAAMITASEQA